MTTNSTTHTRTPSSSSGGSPINACCVRFLNDSANPFGSRYFLDVVHKFDKHQVAAEVSYDLDKCIPKFDMISETRSRGWWLDNRLWIQREG